MADEVRFTVRRFNWRWAGTCFVRAPGEHRLATFDTADEAHADAWRREQEVRGRVNPFACGPAFHYLSTMPEPIYLDWLRDADITPPKQDSTAKRPWAAWWDSTKTGLTESQIFRVWEGLNRVRFFDVIARRPSQVAYAVVRIVWEYNDNWMEPGEEGGVPVQAFRKRENAEAQRVLLEEVERARFAGREDEEPSHYSAFERNRWNDPFQVEHDERGFSVDDVVGFQNAVFYEVVEIDIGGNSE